jgi:hypothetical protein
MWLSVEQRTIGQKRDLPIGRARDAEAGHSADNNLVLLAEGTIGLPANSKRVSIVEETAQ